MAKAKPEAARIPVQKTYKLYIGGAFPRTESGRYLAVNDAKGGFVANICRGSRKDIRNALVAARKAQCAWAARSAFNRGQILYRMAEMLESRAATFERLLVDVAGYSQADAASEVGVATDRLVHYAGWSDKVVQIFGNTNPVASPHFNFTFPEPTGVVAALPSLTSPLLGLVSVVAPIIVAGNTVVVVADGLAPQVAVELAEVLATSDLPGGVVNIVTGLRSELTPHLTAHMDVDAIFAVGADEAAQIEIALAATETVKRTKFVDDATAAAWREDDRQSPYWILPFLEFKTAWHPMGI